MITKGRIDLGAGGKLAVKSRVGPGAQPEEEDLQVSTARVIGEIETGFAARAKAEEKRFYEAVDSEYWVALCFRTREQKEEFLQKMNLEPDEKYLVGRDFAEQVGVKIESPDPVWKKGRDNSEFAPLIRRR